GVKLPECLCSSLQLFNLIHCLDQAVTKLCPIRAIGSLWPRTNAEPPTVANRCGKGRPESDHALFRPRENEVIALSVYESESDAFIHANVERNKTPVQQQPGCVCVGVGGRVW